MSFLDKTYIPLTLYILIFFIFGRCEQKDDFTNEGNSNVSQIDEIDTAENWHVHLVDEFVQVTSDVKLKNYFNWMDSIIYQINQDRNYEITEYNLIHANPWLIYTIANTDYYSLKEKGIISHDSKLETILFRNNFLLIPDSLRTDSINEILENTYLEINIPEFKLRIIQDECIRYEIPIRVGKNKSTYLAMANRIVDLRTQVGEGEIIRINRSPSFINPVNNRPYFFTKRDDGKITKLPNIPWLEPALHGVSVGQLLHPTTNLNTLGKASSNGCIGMRESDAWKVYFHAPLNTKIKIHYDLTTVNEFGDKVTFLDIYPEYKGTQLNKSDNSIGKESASHDILPICTCY